MERNEEEAKGLEIITNETNLLWARYLLEVFFIFLSKDVVNRWVIGR